jgi:peptidoglycan/LPS O-acetylase OafA/YrhL
MQYEPRLNAYRGICITLVFLQHWALLDCGWIGVQAFFVLSGFLITRILREERGAATASSYFGNFYARRSLRIFPLYFAYLLLLAAMVNLGVIGFLRGFDAVLNPALPWLLSYTENFHRMLGGDSSPFYFHLWSLSIEEQFYLAWPLVVYFTPPRRLLAVCLGLIAAAPTIRGAELAWRLHQGLADQHEAGAFIYYFTGSQLDAFAFGALLSLRRESPRLLALLPLLSRWVPVLVAVAGLWMLLLGQAAHDDIDAVSAGWPLHLSYFYADVWGYTLLDALFFVVLAQIDRLGPLLDLQGLQRLGVVSYGFYVFHCPIVSLTRYLAHDNSPDLNLYDGACMLLAFGLSWALAELSFRCFEQPLLRLKRRFARAGAAAVAA